MGDTSVTGPSKSAGEPRAVRNRSSPRRALRAGVCLAITLVLAATAGCAPPQGQGSNAREGEDAPKPRVVVTTDPELDDSNSLIRYLLYSTDFRTEGLIYASSQFHWKGDGMGTTLSVPGREYTRFGLDLCPCESWRWAEGERFIDEAIDRYAAAYENLRVHHPGYPSPAELRSKIRIGNIEFDGDISHDSPGSDLIRSLLLDDGEAPIYLLAWGGQSTIARALRSIEEEFAGSPGWPALREKVSRRAIIQAFGDQDDTYARYIEPNWPGIEFREMATQTWGYGARGAVLPPDQAYLSAGWMKENVSSRGPLGEFYRVWGDGKQMVEGDVFDYFGIPGLSSDELRSMGYIVWMPVQEPGSWISEGDTPAFLNLVDNGLRAHEDSARGGWGGRAGDDVGPAGPDPQYASARFFGAAQRDFAARMQWSVTPTYGAANHPPRVRVRGPLGVRAAAGELVQLHGIVSDPDGDSVALRWWQYAEADGYAGRVAVADSTSTQARVRIPADARAGDTVHLILEATDDGTPALTRYHRVIVEVGGDEER